MVRFFFKCAITLMLLFIAVSFFASRSTTPAYDTGDQTPPTTSTAELITTLGNTLGDLSYFCQRNTQTCETGGRIFTAISDRIHDGAKITYDYLNAYFQGLR